MVLRPAAFGRKQPAPLPGLKRSARPQLGVRRAKAALFPWVRVPPGEMLPPEAIGAVIEVTIMAEAFDVKGH